jgi:hypothetical protein
MSINDREYWSGSTNRQSIETGNTGHTRQGIKTKQKQTKHEHNVRWTPLSASKHK